MPDDSRRFPKVGASEEDVIAYKDNFFSEQATYRDRHMQRICRNIYYEMGRQWVELDTQVMPEGGRGYVFKEMSVEGDIELPRPVDNQIAPAVDVEFATLSKRQWTPKVVTFSRDPRAEASAKVSNDILNDRLEKIHWPDIRDRFIRNLIVHGTAILVSRWDESFRTVTMVGATGAVECPTCRAVYYAREDPSGQPLEACPACADETHLQMGGPPALRPLEVDENLAGATDWFGRPMAEPYPKGETLIELLTPFEYFPENGGID